MKTSLKHLPGHKKEELGKVVDVICGACKEVEMVILFGSYARGNYKEERDIMIDSKSGHVSDYDILVVTKTKEVALDVSLWNKVEDEELREFGFSAKPRIITHDIKTLNKKLEEGQYFYSDVKKEGILLFDSKNYELAKELVLPTKRQLEIAQEYYESWFERSERFFRHFKLDMEEKDLKGAAFNLHQAVEHSYKTILLTISNYCPREHLLKELIKDTEKFHPFIKNFFPQNTQEEENRFKLLDSAYIAGRYDPNFKISKEDLEILAEETRKFLQFTKEICEERIESFKE